MRMNITIQAESDEMESEKESGADSGGNADSECSEGQTFMQTVKAKKSDIWSPKNETKD